MKRMAMVFCVIVVALILVQAPAKAQFGLYGGIALPMSDLGDSKKGAALLGFGGGLEYNASLGAIPVGIVTSLSVTYNDLDSKAVKDGFGSNVDYTPWLAAWPMIGARVSVPAFPLYAQLQIGAAIVKSPEYTLKSAASASETIKADPVAGFGFSAAVGASFGPLNLCARYLDAGKPEFDYGQGQKESLSISEFLITIGIVL